MHDKPRRLTILLREEVAYIAPMAVFLILTQAGVWRPAIYPASYIAKTAITAALLILFWRRHTKIRWNLWWVGALLGIVGVVQWIVMAEWENLLVAHWPAFPRLSIAPFDPYIEIHSSLMRASFMATHLAGASLVVPVMEELFWRDFAWRTILAPNDFRLAVVGEPNWKAWVGVAVLFSCVHVQWPTAIVWGLMIGGLLMWTRSLGACIVMHGATNFLLGLYVLKTGKWYLW